MPQRYFAHSGSRQDHSDWQPLAEHLRQVAEAAAVFGQEIAPGLSPSAHAAGLLHDLGKYAAAFQERLTGQNQKRVVHALQGATWAASSSAQALDIALAVAGHHAGIPALSAFKGKAGQFPVTEFWSDALGDLPELGTLEVPGIPPDLLAGPQRLRVDVWIRLLFSCLVDADFLDTERHFDSRVANQRVTQALSPAVRLAVLLEAIRFKAALVADGPVKAARDDVLQACLDAADLPPGFFSLTVPTGGGKTLASLAFALKHAAKHDLRRVICVLPFLSIIEQNAGVLRDVFGDDFVLEHHSLADGERPARDEKQRSEKSDSTDDGREAESPRHRLACENWDAPLIVTTTVQFFDSLFANRPSRCRKLHNIPRSVVILDECQTLPPGLLDPILSMLRTLVEDYGTTVVFCTATQPAFRQRAKLSVGIPASELREIVPQPERLFQIMRRTRAVWPGSLETRSSWEQLAARMREHEQVLCIVNLRRHARELFETLQQIQGGSDGLFHLSTNLCPAHRLKQLAEIRERLKRGALCRVVSTQLVEAGVDLDFPFLLRAFGPLDAIAQAAGRCNREGRQSEPGVVEIFIPEDDAMPPAEYRRAADTTRAMLTHERNAGRDGLDIHDPATFTEYFERFYGGEKLDAKDIQSSKESPRRKLDFPAVADRFRLIDSATEPVLIADDDVLPGSEKLLERIRAAINAVGFVPRELSRQIQQFQVQRWPHELRDDAANDRVEMLTENVRLWRGRYDEQLGISGGEAAPFDPNQWVI